MLSLHDDRVVTHDGKYAVVMDIIDGAPDIAWLDLGGTHNYRRVSVETLTRAD